VGNACARCALRTVSCCVNNVLSRPPDLGTRIQSLKNGLPKHSIFSEPQKAQGRLLRLLVVQATTTAHMLRLVQATTTAHMLLSPALLLLLLLARSCSAPTSAAMAAASTGGSADPRCRNATTAAADILSTGAVNLLRFGAAADSSTDDAATLRSAISCHNRVFIPAATHWPVAPAKGTPAYLINSTVVLADSDPCPHCPQSVGQVVQLRGVGQHATPATVLRTHGPSPVIQIGDWRWKYSTGAKVTLQDLAIDAVRVGVLVVATSDVHLTRVTVKTTEWGQTGPPEVTIPAEDHAALVVVDVYWLYITQCQFIGATPPGYDGQHNTSKRPSVIFRGQDNPSTTPGSAGVVNQVYLVTITDTEFKCGPLTHAHTCAHAPANR
jgi:hypothetical protein